MPLLDRNKPKRLGNASPSPIEQQPIKTEYDYDKVGNRPRDLTTMLVALQREVYGQTILDRIPYSALEAHAKRLSIKYKSRRIKQAILRAAQLSPAPYSFKYVEQLIIRENQYGDPER